MAGKWHKAGIGASGTEAQVFNLASLFEEGTLEQASQLARGHITSGHVVMLPDAHVGSGACVGTAVVTKDGLYPAAVGVDIGCGMIAVHTTLKADALDVHLRRALRGAIERAVPSGVGKARSEPLEAWTDFVEENDFIEGIWHDGNQRARMYDTASIQFGTLGSGNHFIEVSVDEQGDVWAIVHSGSRGIGNNIARIYIDQAKRLRAKEGITTETPDLAFLRQGEPEFDEYVKGMLWAQKWAMANREAMMDLVLGAIVSVGGGFDVIERINCHHNYSEPTNLGRSDGRYWLTRKGAIDASLGKLGVLPGSMGDDTYIVSGLANQDSYNTSPHGSGRLHARGRPPKGTKAGTGAWAKFNVADFAAEMEVRGVVWQDREAHWLLDENPKMYKPIAVVLADSAELIKPLYKLVQIVNYKGL